MPGCPSPSLEIGERRISRIDVSIIGIDPGKNGGFAVIRSDGPSDAGRMPETSRGVIEELRRIKESGVHVAFVELVGGYIGKAQPASSAFTFGYGCGIVSGALGSLKYETHRIRPQTWQRGLGLRTKGADTTTAWKNHLKSLAEDLFPDIDVTLCTADALLIAEFGRRWLNGNITIDLNQQDEC